jgi:hypothetical protein
MSRKPFPSREISPKAYRELRSLSTPERIQDFVDRLAPNRELGGATLQGVEATLRSRKAHCIEAALVAAAALWANGEPPLLIDLRAKKDSDHVIAVFRRDGAWGAISKSAHATLRYRDAVYASPRELVMSYFHEYLNKEGEKTLRAYSRPFDLSRIDPRLWLSDDHELWNIGAMLDDLPHVSVSAPAALRRIRPADPFTFRTLLARED